MNSPTFPQNFLNYLQSTFHRKAIDNILQWIFNFIHVTKMPVPSCFTGLFPRTHTTYPSHYNMYIESMLCELRIPHSVIDLNTTHKILILSIASLTPSRFHRSKQTCRTSYFNCYLYFQTVWLCIGNCWKQYFLTGSLPFKNKTFDCGFKF